MEVRALQPTWCAFWQDDGLPCDPTLARDRWPGCMCAPCRKKYEGASGARRAAMLEGITLAVDRRWPRRNG